MPSVIRVFNGVQATATSAAYECDGFSGIRAQIWSNNTSTASIQIQVRTKDTTAPWYVQATITNPAVTSGVGGEVWVLPPAGEVRFVIATYAAGQIFVNLERFTVRGTA